MALSKDQQQMIMVGVLLVVLVLVFMNNLKPKKKKPSAAPPPAAAPAAAGKPAGKAPAAGQPAAAAGKVESGESVSGQKERAETLAWGRDPFLPYDEQKIEGTTAFNLQGVSIGKGRIGYALINNEIVKAGDTFMGHKVLEIVKDKVLLEKDGQSFYIVFPQEE